MLISTKVDTSKYRFCFLAKNIHVHKNRESNIVDVFNPFPSKMFPIDE